MIPLLDNPNLPRCALSSAAVVGCDIPHISAVEYTYLKGVAVSQASRTKTRVRKFPKPRTLSFNVVSVDEAGGETHPSSGGVVLRISSASQDANDSALLATVSESN